MNQIGKIKVHMALSLDHKFFPLLKRWALGVLLKTSIYNEVDDDMNPKHLHFVLDLVDVSSPWIAEKSPQIVAVHIKQAMTKLNLWNRRDLPDFNICLDGGLSFAIIKHLKLLGWTNAEAAISTCEGHTSGNVVKLGTNQVQNAIKNKTWIGRFYPRVIYILGKVIFIYFDYSAVGLEDDDHDSDACGHRFADNWQRYRNLFMKSDTKPSQNRLTLNKRLLQLQDRVKWSDGESEELRVRVKNLLHIIYGRVNDEDLKYCSISLKLKSYPEKTKYRELFRKLMDFTKCLPFIYEIMDEDPIMRQHIYGSDEPVNFRFDDFFIQSMQRLIQFKQHWLKETEQVKSTDNNYFYEIFADAVDYILATPRSQYAIGSGPLSDPFQQ